MLKHDQMKIRLTHLTIALMASIDLQAQLSFGIRSGISWSNVDFPQADGWDSKARLAPAFGAMLHIAATERIGIQPEVAFVSRGYRQEYGPLPSGNYAEHLVFDFVDVNALMVLRLAQEPARPHLLLGPSIGFMTGARVLAEIDGSVSGGSVLDPVKLKLNRALAGLCGGAGFTFSAGASLITVEGRYAFGLTDIWNDLTLVDINGATIRKISGYDRSFSLHLGWLMPVAKRALAASAGP